MGQVLLSASFDNLRSRHVRLLQEAARLGQVHVLLWSDKLVQTTLGHAPRFPQNERQYFLESLRFVDRVSLIGSATSEADALPEEHLTEGSIWVVQPTEGDPAKEAFCRERQLGYCVIREEQLRGFPDALGNRDDASSNDGTKVLVTGCFDWLHSGHVRFFEEASELGDLYVVIGHDGNIRLLKGEGHPMHSEDERRYMAAAVRFVKRAFVSTGSGWLDAEPEIERIQPDVYAVNEDGDRPEKRDYCQTRGIEYRVLSRRPKEGLPRRESTALRGF